MTPERSRWMAEDWRDHPVWAPGSIIPDLPMAEYHSGPGVSKSKLDKAHRNVRSMLQPAPDESKPHLDLGSAINDAIVDRDLFTRRFVRGFDDRRGNRWKEAKAEAEANGQVLMVAADYDLAVEWGEAVRQHPIAAGMLDSSLHSEATLVWEDEETGLLCRCRPDVVTHSWTVVDVKTARSAAPRDFRAAIFKYRYHVSAVMTTLGVRSVLGSDPGYVFLVIDKDGDPTPEGVALYQLDDEFRIRGLAELRSDLERVADYLRSAAEDSPTAWAGYSLGVERLTYFRGDAL